MRILSIRNLLGAAAVYGAVQYARKNGGFQNAFQQLSGKIRQAAKDLDLQGMMDKGDKAMRGKSMSSRDSVEHGIGSRSSSGLGQRDDLDKGFGGSGGSGGYGGGFGGGSRH